MKIYDDSTKNPQVNSKTQASFNKGNINEYIRKLDFKLDDSIKSAIKNAENKPRPFRHNQSSSGSQ